MRMAPWNGERQIEASHWGKQIAPTSVSGSIDVGLVGPVCSNRGRPLGNDLTLALHLYFCRGKAQKDLTNAVEWPTLIGRSAILSLLDGTS